MIHDSVVEWIFVVTSLLGFGWTAWFFVRASENYSNSTDTASKIVFDDKKSGGAIRMMASGFSLIGSIIILFVAPPPPPSSEALQSSILILICILVQACAVFSSWMSWQSQGKLETYVEAQPPSGSIQIARTPEILPERRRYSTERRKTPEEREIIASRQAIQDDLSEVKNDVKIVKRDVKEVKEGIHK